MTQKPFAEWVVFVPILHLISLWHFIKHLRFPRDLLVAAAFILTGFLISRALPCLPESPLINAAALYLTFLAPVLMARFLAQRQN